MASAQEVSQDLGFDEEWDQTWDFSDIKAERVPPSQASKDIVSEEWRDYDDLLVMADRIDQESDRIQQLDEDKDWLVVDRLQLRAQTPAVFDLTVGERISHFWIDANQEYQTSKPLPTLKIPEIVKDDDFEEDLDSGFDTNRLIPEYEEYREKKWQYFLETIKKNNYLTIYEPHFVAFGGPIGDVLAVVYDTNIGLKIFAQKKDGVIYLSKTRYDNNPIPSGYHAKEAQMNSFNYLRYVHFLTGEEYETMSEVEKCFAINLLQLADHRVILLSELNAIDDEGRAIDAKLVTQSHQRNKDFYHKKKLLRFWCKAVVQGIDRLLIGTKTSNRILFGVDQQKVATIPAKCSWSAVKCIDFLKRFFDFAKSCVTEDNRVYELIYNRGEGFVICNRLHPRVKATILPDNY